jgi:hypothetical protein
MKNFFLHVLCFAGTVFFCSPSQAQGVGDYTSSIASFKVKYPKTDVIAVNYKEEYQFNTIRQSNAGPVGAQCSVSATLVPLKDFVTNSDAVFYDGESTVEGVHALNSKNKNIQFGLKCMDYQSDGIFYSDAKVCVVSLPLEEKGMPVIYAYDKKFKDVKYLTTVYKKKPWCLISPTGCRLTCMSLISKGTI